jgi:hypothetical protein
MLKIGHIYSLATGIVAKKQKLFSKRAGNVYLYENNYLLVGLGPYRWIELLSCKDSKVYFYWLDPYKTPMEFFNEVKEEANSDFTNKMMGFIYKMNPQSKE